MGLFGKLFGRKPAPEIPAVENKPLRSIEDLRKDPNQIQVFDKFGQEMFIEKEKWRTDILPGAIRDHWDKPDELYGVIFGALNDGFRSDVVAAAKRLYAIDSNPSRGSCVWGIVLMEEGRLDEAERIFRKYLSRHGEEGSVLTNLAKVYARQNDNSRAEQILWHALEVDPNQDNGLSWYEAIHRERGGQEAGLDALRRIAALPGSWRAQLWLARAALQSKQPGQALDLYREALERVPRPIPTDLLMQMSGDLGNAGHLIEILQLVEPLFDPVAHGLQVGNNLIKANLDLGQIDGARRIMDRLYALKRPDWRGSLGFWDTEIAKARVELANVDETTPVKMSMLIGQGPIWLKPDSPAAELYPAKPADSLVVGFLGSTAKTATNSKRIRQELSDSPGRLSRALALFLAEQVEMGSHARSQTLVPWMVEPQGSFVLSGVPCKDEDAAAYARQGEIKCDYVVISHLLAHAEPWVAELRLVRTIDGRCLGELSESFLQAHPTEDLLSLSSRLLELLAREADIERQAFPALYSLPQNEYFSCYLLRLEQLLAIRCAGMEGTPQGFLNGEREVIDGNIQQCLAFPNCVNTRILLLQTLIAMKRVRPEILPEFKDRLTLLQQEHPLIQPAQAVLQPLFNEVLSA